MTWIAADRKPGWREITWREIRAAAGKGPGGDAALDRAVERPAEPRARVLPEELAERLRASGAPLGDRMVEPQVPAEAERNAFLADLQLVRHRFVQDRCPTACLCT